MTKLFQSAPRSKRRSARRADGFSQKRRIGNAGSPGSGSGTGSGSIQPYSVSGLVASTPSSTTNSGRARTTSTAWLTAVMNAPSSET